MIICLWLLVEQGQLEALVVCLERLSSGLKSFEFLLERNSLSLFFKQECLDVETGIARLLSGMEKLELMLELLDSSFELINMKVDLWVAASVFLD